MNFKRICAALFAGLVVCAVSGAEAKPVEMIIDGANLQTPVWKQFQRESVIAPEKVAGPNGKIDAYALKVVHFWGQVIRNVQPGKTYRFTVWMKSATGKDQSVNLMGEVNVPGAKPASVSCKVTPEWKSYSIDYKAPDASAKNYRFSIRRADIHVFGPSVIEVK